MKIQHIISILLLAVGITVGAQTTNAPVKPMSYTLMYEESPKTIKNPTEADFRAALDTQVGGDNGPVFRISVDGTEELLQVIRTDKDRFGFNYFPSAKKMWGSKRDSYGHDEALKIVLAFWGGSPDWKKSVEWKLYDLE